MGLQHVHRFRVDEIVALLLSRNADRDLRDGGGQTAAKIAEASANWKQSELDAMRQHIGRDDRAYFEQSIANWRAIVAMLARR